MINEIPSNWKYDDSMEMLFLFYQKTDELLSETTPDTYALPLHNAITLFNELNYTYNLLFQNNMLDSYYNNYIIPIINELLYLIPQTTLPKQSAVKILRYHTDEKEGTRETLETGYPITIEGDLYTLIHESVRKTKEIVERTGTVGDSGASSKQYPEITLHEIITNAIIHRDYSVKKDVQIRIFTTRIEVESPGKLPGHITLENILKEQCARNPKIVRLLSKFPSPPNKDVGEGLNSAFKAMTQMQLKQPTIQETENSVIVEIKHERLADAETVVWDYLQTHDTICNSIGRQLTGITDANKMKNVFLRLKNQGKIKIVEGTKGNATKWTKTDTTLPVDNDTPLLLLIEE